MMMLHYDDKKETVQHNQKSDSSSQEKVHFYTTCIKSLIPLFIVYPKSKLFFSHLTGQKYEGGFLFLGAWWRPS